MAEIQKVQTHGEAELNRRQFIERSSSVALAVGVLPTIGFSGAVRADEAKPVAETAVSALFQTLTEAQRKVICFPFEHELRRKHNANWKITEPLIGSDFYSVEQRGLIDEIFKGVTSEDGYGRFQKQMDDDAGGFGEYAIAVFGEPGSGKFEWEMTGRHLTMRADGDSVDKMAFGGPIVYGHGEGDSVAGLPGNVFSYQVKMANTVFQALDSKQRTNALVAKAPTESDVGLQGAKGEFTGISVSELSSDQQELVEMTVKVILSPYREKDVEEVLSIIKAGGGLQKLNMSFYNTDYNGDGDLGEDGEWNIWRLEGPTFVWHFRGQPHVHTYVNIGQTG